MRLSLQLPRNQSRTYLPGFRYAGPRLHQGKRCVILGDSAPTVKPYFGLGANSALEDVKILGEALQTIISM
jgi:kynurenine 3-monooxygenase